MVAIGGYEEADSFLSVGFAVVFGCVEPNGVGAFVDMGGYPPEDDDAEPENGVGAFIDIAGYEEADSFLSVGFDAAFGWVEPNGVGAFVDMGGYAPEEDFVEPENGVGALVDIGGYEEADDSLLIGFAADSDFGCDEPNVVAPNGVGAFVDIGG